MVCFSKLDQSSFTLLPDLKEIHMDTCRIGSFKDIPFCYFIEAKGERDQRAALVCMQAGHMNMIQMRRGGREPSGVI